MGLGRVSEEQAKLHAETEFEKYRIIQERLCMCSRHHYHPHNKLRSLREIVPEINAIINGGRGDMKKAFFEIESEGMCIGCGKI